jgi:hypothetical protein
MVPRLELSSVQELRAQEVKFRTKPRKPSVPLPKGPIFRKQDIGMRADLNDETTDWANVSYGLKS